MAPIKFEEQIKDKLEKRTLSPSTKSWSKLSERLDDDQKKTKNPLYWWLSIAATLVIMLAVAVQYYGKSEVEQVIPVLVNEETKQEAKDEKQPNDGEVNSLELASEDHPMHVEEKKNDAKPQNPQILDYKKQNTTSNSNTRLAQNNEIQKNTESQTTGTSLKEAQVLNKELILDKTALADALKDINVAKASVTEREIDSLLKIASNELLMDKLQKETTKTVDATRLLMEVEEDMGQSFRSKVFDALKDSYETVKTAVVQRNN